MTFAWVAALVLAADWLSKAAVRQWMVPGQSIAVLPGFFYLTYTRNSGAAFSLFQGGSAWLAGVTLVISAVVVLFALRQGRGRPWLQVALGLILGGALGNLTDRLARGWVVDFLDFRVWPVFNLADSSVVVGALLLAWQLLAGEEAGRPRA
ncbi:MAG: signal peptidase II [Firmicutes bacterium]|nr:signal peptidase II [Bacillota bacterium]